MGDNLKPEDRRRTMQAVKGKGTRLERRLFSMLAGMGVRGWKKNVASVVGKPDVVFGKQRVAIFVDGCFWHGCPVCRRKLPQTNHEYWVRKINRNVAKAEAINDQLRGDGWTVVRIWEHEVRKAADLERVRGRILQAVLLQGRKDDRRPA
jgi:DNA mismatch endonuclease, patch repair protein